MSGVVSISDNFLELRALDGLGLAAHAATVLRTVQLHVTVLRHYSSGGLVNDKFAK